MISLDDLIWRAAEPRVFVSREKFLASLEGWEKIPIGLDPNDPHFILLQRGPEFHLQIVRDGSFPYKLYTRKLGEIIAERGYAATRTPRQDQRQIDLNLATGFEETGGDDLYVDMRITKIRTRRDRSCQS